MAAAAVAVEWARVALERQPGWSAAALAGGGLALCSLAILVPAGELGLRRRHLVRRLAAGAALGAVLLLPAAARGLPLPGLPAALAMPAICVAVGEEVAFRGALFALLRRAFGPAAAILGSTGAFVLAHVLSHPASFLLPVAALGVLLGIWRWLFQDLVAPVTAHVLADLSL